jgi:lipopolysaccharide export system permease protein
VNREQTLFRLGLPTWWRYLFVRFGLLVAALTAIAFTLFVFVDLLARVKDIFDPETSWQTWRIYYACMLSTRAGVIIPFAIVTATALLIPRLVRNNELVPLMTAGISLQQMFRPFLAVTLVASAVLFANAQWFLPKALQHQQRISDSEFGRKTVHDEPARLGVVLFSDGSRLFFSQHDPVKRLITDAFWVCSPDYVLHIEQLLYFQDRSPEGRGVDVVEREPSGRMRKIASYPSFELSQLHLTKDAVKMSMADPKMLSVFQLGTLVSRFGLSCSERATETTIAFFSKLFSPCLAWLALLLPAPFCFRFERRLPQALLVFLSLAFLFSFLLIIHASEILARIPILRPTPFLIFPWACAVCIGIRRMQRVV